tara:strand:- start:57 stop:689 length:633 start_codon:yes stop_codon:yes gene_type:complete
MEFFKKNPPLKSEKKEVGKTKALSIDEESKKTIRKIKLAQEKHIEEACFFMVQESALDKGIKILQQLTFQKNEKGLSETDIPILESEIIRLSILLQKKIEKFLLTEKRGEQAPPIRNFLITLKEIEKSDPEYQEVDSIKQVLKLFIKTKEDFTQERIKSLSLAKKLEEKGNVQLTEGTISVEETFITEDPSKALGSNVFSSRKGLERLLN